MKEDRIKTRKDEIRFKTLEPKKLLNTWTTQKVCRYWMEDFVDQDTNEVVSIKRNEVILSRGTLITQDVLQKISFWIQEGTLTEPIEVSNQKRLAIELISTHLYPWTIQVIFEGNRKHRFICYAPDITTTLEIVKDFVELNFSDNFSILQVKEMDSCIILEDNLTDRHIDLEKAYLAEEISFDEYTHAKALGGDEDQNEVEDRKFYQMEVTIIFSDDQKSTKNFIIHTFDTDRALVCISHYIQKLEEKIAAQHEEKGYDPYEIREFKLRIEKAVPMPMNTFIPKEFSLAYAPE